MCTRNFDPVKDWSEEDRKRVMDYLRGKRSKASIDRTHRKRE
jgi:hypothetical protein